MTNINPWIPLLISILPYFFLWKKGVDSRKKDADKAAGDNFNNIMVATKTIRDEQGIKIKELEGKLESQLKMQNEMGKIIISHTNKISEITSHNEALSGQLKITLGMNIIDVKKVKISVLEDNKNDAELLKRLLDANNIENVTYYSSTELFCNDIDVDVRIIIIDHKLSGGITGIGVIKKILDLAEQQRNKNDYRYFIMLSGMEDFNVIYNFNKLITHGIYILKGQSDTNDLLVDSIKNTIYYLQLLSDTYNEIKTN